MSFVASENVRWRLQNTPLSIDVYFEVMGEVDWTRTYRARKGSLICGGAPLVAARGAGPRTIRPTIIVGIGSDRNTRVTALETAWLSPTAVFALTQPGHSPVNVQIDTDVQYKEQWMAGHRVVQMGFFRVT